MADVSTQRMPVQQSPPQRRKRRLSAAHKAKLSAAARGRKHTEATKAKIGAASTGRRHSEETKARIGAAMQVAKTGKPLSAAHRKAISDGLRQWAAGRTRQRNDRAGTDEADPGLTNLLSRKW